MKNNRSLILVALALLVFSSCKVEFSPNAPWREVPAVYCVLDPEEDTVWARVQRCFLGEDNLYNYAPIADSNYYREGEIAVHLLAWRGKRGNNNSLTATNQLVDRWELSYTERSGKPEGSFPSGMQPLYYCVPGNRLMKDTACVFQLVVLHAATGDTLATATTTMVGLLEKKISGRDTTEEVLLLPNHVKGHEFGFIIGCRGEIQWNTLPRGRKYQPIVTFYYKKNGDTLSIDIPGVVLPNEYNYNRLSSKGLTQNRFLSHIKQALTGNTDSLFNVNNVDITIAVCNEDLNAYINSRDNTNSSGGQEYRAYSNVEGGVGVFGARRAHIRVNVPCDSTGKEGYIPDQLRKLGVGFYGQFQP